MNRAERLRWWRQGYEAGLAAGSRQRHDEELAAHHAAVADFHAQRKADQQTQLDALILEAVDILARAMLSESDNQEAA